MIQWYQGTMETQTILQVDILLMLLLTTSVCVRSVKQETVLDLCNRLEMVQGQCGFDLARLCLHSLVSRSLSCTVSATWK